jgi:hypothetical protein
VPVGKGEVLRVELQGALAMLSSSQRVGNGDPASAAGRLPQRQMDPLPRFNVCKIDRTQDLA